ncbi:ATP-dependent DNA helicase [Trichonephila clavipes]|uniref:ATP-dependent DNA helicase n=1 Tax=Trichonephila clavipes TaxID=2585209 RepID=A0A8X6ST25_TRICX|nr:ATP-dependent DNA helicase [Trichonephila clavipes]
MRTEPHEQEFASWLLHLNNGTSKNDYQSGEYIVEVPEKCVLKESIVEEIFGSFVFDKDNLSGKAILSPNNEYSLKIN